MYRPEEKRKHFLRCNIAGFTYYDGCIAFEDLCIGTKLTLVRDENNKYDSKAIAFYFEDLKLGYIPANENEPISSFFDMGYGNIFEARISQLSENSHPEKQVWVNIYIKRRED